jgi:hypothetical protein
MRKNTLIKDHELFQSKNLSKSYIYNTNSLISCFHEVLTALLILYKLNCILPPLNNPISPRIAQDSKYTPYFDDCLGALDGMHIEMYIPLLLQPRYRNRKGGLLQNMLAVCNFEMRFVYILAG